MKKTNKKYINKPNRKRKTKKLKGGQNNTQPNNIYINIVNNNRKCEYINEKDRTCDLIKNYISLNDIKNKSCEICVKLMDTLKGDIKYIKLYRQDIEELKNKGRYNLLTRKGINNLFIEVRFFNKNLELVNNVEQINELFRNINTEYKSFLYAINRKRELRLDERLNYIFYLLEEKIDEFIDFLYEKGIKDIEIQEIENNIQQGIENRIKNTQQRIENRRVNRLTESQDIMDKKINIYFIRHGLSCANIVKKSPKVSKLLHTIIKDPILTDTGINNSEDAGNIIKDIKFDIVYSSVLKRAIETAVNMFPNNTIKPSPYIEELGLGLDNTPNSLKKLDKWLNKNSLLQKVDTKNLQNKKKYKKSYALDNFLNIIVNDVLNMKQEEINIGVVTHSNFMSKYNLLPKGMKAHNNSIYKTEYKLLSNKILQKINEPEKIFEGFLNEDMSKIDYKRCSKLVKKLTKSIKINNRQVRNNTQVRNNRQVINKVLKMNATQAKDIGSCKRKIYTEEEQPLINRVNIPLDNTSITMM